jgi:hypothetical protein
MNHINAQDLSAAAVATRGALDVSMLTGTWANTNPSAQGIVRLVLTESGGNLAVRVFGAGTPEPFDWGEVPACPFADGVALTQASSFTALYKLSFMSVWLQTYVVKGVLVVVTFTQFRDDSGRSSYFGKEFFFRV